MVKGGRKERDNNVTLFFLYHQSWRSDSLDSDLS